MSNNKEIQSGSKWPVEVIPDSDILFRRVHTQYAPDGELQPNAFKNAGPGFSANWMKYCPTPNHSRDLARNPSLVGIVSLIVERVRKIPLAVTHTPARDDRSHTTISGADAEARVKLLEIAKWEVKP